ncbi:TIM-barrel domain-containing protein [Nonomuraea sp. NPDC050783]|uniref:TIM-barrel domain-containing protein n=1 Tax=Nonomuraea sp. NPDC050783 TaxID=3154634 RepID=UPI003467ABEE
MTAAFVLVLEMVVVIRPAQAAAGVVIDGQARFQVLTPTLIRLEYAQDGTFEDRPTFNAVVRDFPPPSYTTGVENGSRVIRTGKLTLRYRQNSGPFTPDNLTVDLQAGTQAVTARPTWPLAGHCGPSTVCEAETAVLSGGAEGMNDEPGYAGPGFVAGMWNVGAQLSWTQRGINAAGQYRVHLRYSSAPGNGVQQSVTLTAGNQRKVLRLPATATWGTWATTSTLIDLPAGDSTLSLRCEVADQCHFNVDHVAVTPPAAGYPTHVAAAHQAANLGGWRRSLDTVEAEDGRPLPVMMHEGLLSRDGWYLLNDTETAVTDQSGTTTPRPRRTSPYQDGYFFGYGHDYKRGLQDLRALTGPPVMLPRYAFGVWWSEYAEFDEAFYRDTLLPLFRSERVPLDVLVVDTDFKSPNKWNGWSWDRNLFPDPARFLSWARSEGMQVALNIHPSITTQDPRYAEVRARLNRDLARGECGPLGAGLDCRVFNMSDPAEAEAYFALHDGLEKGPVLWWLDSCCDSSRARPDGISPDTLFNALYARRADAQGRRGFSWNRSGSGYTGYGGGNQLYPAGPWAEHRYTVDTSMDTTSTWNMLGFASTYTIRRGNIGMPYESHDIGGHNYDGDASNLLPPDLYARWVQLGAFQPILRLHSNHGYRLPWDYPEPARSAAAAFLRLREALLPYTYSLAREAHETGLPMNRGMYLNYPEHNEAYTYDKQFLYGDDVLVAPVSTPGTGTVQTQVWIPPGTWIDYFTGRALTGPAVHDVSTTLATMPVLLRAGGILPIRTDYVDHHAQRPLAQVTLEVAAGGAGSFSLYEDEGEGHGHRDGQAARTRITYEQSSRSLTIAARAGTFPGAVSTRTWTARFRNVAQPAGVQIDGRPVSGWTYEPATRTLTVRTSALPVTAPVTITYS